MQPKTLLEIFFSTALPILLFGALLGLVPVLLKRWFANTTHNQYQSRHIMTTNEKGFFRRLQRANADGYVFPQVSFLALLEPTSGNKRNWWRAFGYIAKKRVDYAIYDDKLELLCIVELDDRTHNTKQDKQRDAAFASAGIKTLRWQASNKPGEGEIRARLEQLKPS